MTVDLLLNRYWFHPYTMTTKSRIPQSSSQNRLEQNPKGDPRAVHEAFNSLGAPSIEPEEFNRLYIRPFADVLLFLSEHVKGRRRVALDRHHIHQYVRWNLYFRFSRQIEDVWRQQEMLLQSNIRRPSDLPRPTVEKSASLLSSSKKTMKVYREQLKEARVVLEDSGKYLS